ncbi:MAG: diguanylate cyclase (GGDEF)-like protein/PAS domain S-box-containing protein [Halioglobus sp.]|jgi:diguanylate cyclase (GGDEF)-like protein/PAS domain S-box-containing protein
MAHDSTHVKLGTPSSARISSSSRNWKDVVLSSDVLSPVFLGIFYLFLNYYYSELLLHTLIELYCISLGVLIFSVYWSTRSFSSSGFLGFLSCGYLPLAVIDGFHALSMPGMPFFGVHDLSLTTHFWIYARFFEALLFLIAPVFFYRRFYSGLAFFVLTLIAVLLIVVALNVDKPVFIDAQGLTGAKIKAELLIIAVLLAALVVYVRLRHLFPVGTLKLLLCSMSFTIVSEMCFTLYLNEDSPIFLVGHLFKFLSFWFVYLAVVKTTLTRPFETLSSNARSYEALPYPALLLAADCTIVQVNDRGLDLIGKNREEVRQSHVHGLFHDCAVSLADCALCRAAAAGLHVDNASVCRAGDGDLGDRYFLVSMAPLKQGNVNAGILQFSVEVTAQKNAENALRESEQRYQALVESMSVAVVESDINGHVVYVNAAFCNLSGLTLKEIQLTGLVSVLHEDDHDKLTAFWKDLYSHKPSEDIEIRIRKKGGTEVRQVLVSMPGAVRNERGEITAYISTGVDITELETARQRLSIISHAVEQAPVSVVITDLDGSIEYVNEAFEELTGYSIDDVRGKNPRVMKSDTTPPEVYEELWLSLINGDDFVCELQNKKKSGELFWERAHFSVVKDDGGMPYKYMTVKEDISLLKKQAMELQLQANYDALTDLPNRFLSLDRLKELIIDSVRTRNAFAVLFLDLDDFKKVNDSLGHEFGDKLLCVAADRLRACVRAGDTVGRLGGDEFVIFLRDSNDVFDVQAVANKVLAALRKHYIIEQHTVIVSSSIGIAVYPEDGDSAEILLRNADIAMYKAKAVGHGSYAFYKEDMNHQVQRQMAVETQIEGALSRREFTVHYQPKYDFSSRRIMGAEALLRWNNVALGQVSPKEFIEVAERTGAIIKIGYYVLQQALTQTRAWQQEGYEEFSIAVNLSPRQFRDPNLIETIAEIIESSQVSAANIELEITEGVLISSDQYVEEAIGKLIAMGIRITMDDFGTGYSSLSYLRKYPFSVVKIDQSFVCEIGTSLKDRQLIEASIAMAHALGSTVVAEGVETEEQFAFLQALDCDYAQGFLLSKPLEALRFTELLAAPVQWSPAAE